MFLGLPDPDPLDRGTDQRIRIRIRIRTKISWIRNSGFYTSNYLIMSLSLESRRLFVIIFGRFLSRFFKTFMEPSNRFQGSQGIYSAGVCRLTGQYDNPIPTRFLVPIDFSKISALVY
jgi:hypothetical protein